MAYTKYSVACSNLTSDLVDILIARLSELGCESFEENDEHLHLFLPENKEAEKSIAVFLDQMMLDWSKSNIGDKNWNEAWEKGFREILVDDTVMIKADFHLPEILPPYVIDIHPKMAFGTGHHETTRLMIRQMMTRDFSEKTVLDWGTGSGVLAILAEKLKAKSVFAVDTDDWAINNTKENLEINKCRIVDVAKGSLGAVPNTPYDVILANINRNTLLNNIAQIKETLIKGGELMISGFYQSDLPFIKDEFKKYGLNFEDSLQENEWCTAYFVNL
jgi:ribosomal protein L11 methyltransferase